MLPHILEMRQGPSLSPPLFLTWLTPQIISLTDDVAPHTGDETRAVTLPTSILDSVNHRLSPLSLNTDVAPYTGDETRVITLPTSILDSVNSTDYLPYL